MGHAFQDTIMDALTRYHRMRGDSDAVAAGHRPRRHRHADGGRAAAQRRGQEAHRPRARGIRRARVAMEGAVRRHDRAADAPPRRLGRLVARALHDGRGPVARGHRGVRAPARGGPDLPRQAPGELGSGAAHRAVRPRGAVRGRGRVSLWHLRYPLERRQRPPRRRDHAAGDDARRHRRGRAPGRRALPAPDRQAASACRSPTARSRSSPTTTSIRRSAPAA